MGYIDHAVRRALEHPHAASFAKRAVEKGHEIKVPAWGAAIVIVSFVLFVAFISAVEYTLKDVVATLAMIETPSAAITVSPSGESAPKDVKEALLEDGPAITLVHQKPLTSSIRATIRHVVSEAGKLARWRGYLAYFIYHFCFNLVANGLDSVMPRFPGRLVLVAGAAGALTANLHAAWTHKVISMPHTTRFFRTIPARSNWKLLALPAAINASAVYLSVYVAHISSMVLGLHGVHNDKLAEYSGAQWTFVVLRIVAVIAIAVSCALFIVLPAHVTQIRIEASILPEEQDTIVPFDRTFSGKVVPQILGGTGAVGFLDAWRSFGWEARRRLVKLYAKIFFVVIALCLVAAHVLAFEVFAIMGPAVSKFLAQAKQHGMAT
ncbi:hypothetical protein BCR34DRAFT_593988 [Clohesyomyces aquaticus]|uniref:Uncharacterized protein n=1 Tax=Clohesyomyces aquaticus TaxID=1231657 RepID=A0A1Y1YDH0_9PLEO|nr:hypothetical protein BCR34DRAFT_593988 [Clohesyomyces aquaticus]